MSADQIWVLVLGILIGAILAASFIFVLGDRYRR